MCIIIYKPKNCPLPDKSILKTAFQNNPDGAGFMFNEKNKDYITIKKGYMLFNKFYKAITEQDFYSSDLIIHFRIATNGSIIPGNCHPFPITGDTNKLKSLSINSRIGLAHNGTINFCKIPKKDNTEDLSDTQVFVKNHLSFLEPEQIKNNEIFNSTYSKFVIMDAQDVWLYGDFITDNGIYYSNFSYQNYKDYNKYNYKWDKYFYSDIYDEYKDIYPINNDLCCICGIEKGIVDDTEGNLYCENCYYDYFFFCEECEEFRHISEQSITGDICKDCNEKI